MVGYLKKEKKKWAQMSRNIGQEEAGTRTSGIFYKMVVQATVLFGAEYWVMSSHIRRTLGGFHHKVDGQM